MDEYMKWAQRNISSFPFATIKIDDAERIQSASSSGDGIWNIRPLPHVQPPPHPSHSLPELVEARVQERIPICSVPRAVEWWSDEERRLLVAEQCRRACDLALEIINMDPKYECYELVEAMSREVIIAWGVWYHLNFTARRKTLDGKGGSELCFAELNTITQKITTFKSLEPTGDGPVPKNGCRYCSTSLKPEIFHPGNDDFVMGSPNPKMALEYQQNNQKSF